MSGRDHIGAYVVRDEADRIVAETRAPGDSMTSGSEANNARLVAAAPDLLAACEAVADAASEIILLSDKSTNAGSAAAGAAITLKRLVLDAVARATGGTK